MDKMEGLQADRFCFLRDKLAIYDLPTSFRGNVSDNDNDNDHSNSQENSSQ